MNKQNNTKDADEIIKAVAHIGIDFGYGNYELEQKHIDSAREIYESGGIIQTDKDKWISVEDNCLKDNEIAAFVNDLVRTAQVFGSTQQIREHIRIDVLSHLPSPPKEKQE